MSIQGNTYTGKIVNKNGKILFRYKGKFMSEEQYNEKMKCLSRGKRRKKAHVPVEEDKECVVQGRRVVDFKVMAQFMQCIDCNDSTLHLVDIEKETRSGLASIFHIRCRKCLLINYVPTNDHDAMSTDGRGYTVNSEAVNSCFNYGLDLSLFRKFLNILEIPGENSNLFNQVARIIGPETKLAAKFRRRNELKLKEIEQKKEERAIIKANYLLTGRRRRRKKKNEGLQAQVDNAESVSKPKRIRKKAVKKDEAKKDEDKTKDNQNESQSESHSLLQASQSNTTSTVTQTQTAPVAAVQQTMAPVYANYQQQLFNQYLNYQQDNNAPSTSQENFFAELYMTPKVPPKKAMTQQYVNSQMPQQIQNQTQNQNQNQFSSTAYNFQTNPLDYLP